MADWPSSIPIPDKIEDVVDKPFKIQQSSCGYTISSNQPTTFTRLFKLTWGLLSTTDKNILLTFFSENMGGSFSWENPTTGGSYPTIFNQEVLSFKYQGIDNDDVCYWSTSVSLLVDGIILAKPRNTVAPVASVDLVIFSVTNGSWLNAPTTYTYQWKKDGSNIDGEVNNTYVGSSNDYGHLISCMVVASNQFGYAEKLSNIIDFGASIKSVIIDIADNWGHTSFLGMRSVEFLLNDVLYPYTLSDITAYNTTTIGATNFHAKFIFDTTTSKTSSVPYTSWQTNVITNQRLIVVFNDTMEFDGLIINNFHDYGTHTNYGAKNIKIYTSTDEITSTVYNETIPNSSLIFDGQLAQHTASNVIDDQIIPIYQ